MRKMLFAVMLLGIAVLLAMPATALTPGTFTYAGYTITVTPDDPDHPGQAGTIEITNDDGTVNLTGTYVQTTTRPPSLVITLSGTIVTGEGTLTVDPPHTFTFAPQTKRMVWKQIVAWIESLKEL